MVLAALSLLLLALMVALSFNLSHALRGKTRLQQHSDALAYSMATLEARSLNYFAVSNRAIASSYVAMNSMHASMTAASVTAEMYSAGESNFYQIAAMEAALSGNKCKHCPHIVQAVRIARKFRQASSQQRSRIQRLENKFNKTVKSLDRLMDSLHASQRSVFAETSQVLSGGTAHGLAKLQQINAPKASALSPGVGKLNSAEFACAIDGMPCRVSGRPGDTALADRAKEMTILSNATRTNWIANRGKPSLPRYLHPEFLRLLTRDIQGEGFSQPQSHLGTAKTVQNRGKAALHEGPSLQNTGQVISADEHGILFSQWKHGIGRSSYEARISSDVSGGEHVPRKSHSGTHDQFQGNYTSELMSCANKGHCFMKFRADPSPERDFGQPPVYSYVTQQLRAGDVRQAPWELNEAGSVKLRFGTTGEGTLELAAGEGAGLSKALVYYHRLGDWQEPPNLFNPFWRAKLHPFTASEASKVLDEAGNPDAAQLAETPRLPM
ncbi:hypothetical protein [Hyalangium minutum]|uniref:Uncharacterized protein n=1 Tax=Hyalangium minutum TaxID=394096 RepID=A0A085WMP7_9BACT|nr:hypothetical protein [Hyalangium minutum]KFE68960.1 hypothetical protein DB31_6862 [Hyalangium minutum]